ncbi:MAG: hydroxyacid dehydrogenase [Betaproteobacteria bacterium]
MSGSRPLVLLDPFPRNNAMILRPADRARLEAMAELRTVESGALPDATVEASLPDVVAILGQTPLPAARIARAPRLKAVFNVEGNFFPNVDYAACFARGIRVGCVAPVFARPVAEYALALTLDVMRGVTAADRAFRRCEEAYGWRGNIDACTLYGASIGIVGFGNIARALVPLLKPFGGPLRVFDAWLPDALVREHGVEPVALEFLLSNSQVVIVLAAATATNRHFLGAAELGRLRDGCKLVLLSRPDVVDHDALHAALRSGRIEAAIDVFPDEPVAVDDPIRTMERTILSSHRAGGLAETLLEIGTMATDDLELVLRGLPPVRLQMAQPETIGLQRSRPGLPLER